MSAATSDIVERFSRRRSAPYSITNRWLYIRVHALHMKDHKSRAVQNMAAFRIVVAMVLIALHGYENFESLQFAG